MEDIYILIKDLWFDEKRIFFHLSDDRVIGIPKEWYKTISTASKKQLENWELIADGVGVHWPDLDEDLSAEGLLTYSPIYKKGKENPIKQQIENNKTARNIV